MDAGTDEVTDLILELRCDQGSRKGKRLLSCRSKNNVVRSGDCAEETYVNSPVRFSYLVIGL